MYERTSPKKSIEELYRNVELGEHGVSTIHEWARKLVRERNEKRLAFDPLIILKGIRDVTDYVPNSKEHLWLRTNMVTVWDGGRDLDYFRCERCSITGRRFGNDANVILDYKFTKLKLYQRCDQTLVKNERDARRDR